MLGDHPINDFYRLEIDGHIDLLAVTQELPRWVTARVLQYADVLVHAESFSDIACRVESAFGYAIYCRRLQAYRFCC